MSADPAAVSRPGVPVTVIAGYLGAGKTTLVNRLLCRSPSIRFAVLVNDFGSLGIDADLIETRSDRTINLINGCVCCAIRDDLATAFEDLSKIADRLDHVLLEASGVADASKLGSVANTWPGFALRQILLLVDTTRTRSLVDDKFVGAHIRRQLNHADQLLLSKSDLLSSAAQDSFERWLHELTDSPIRNLRNLAIADLLHPPPAESRHAMARRSRQNTEHPHFETRTFTSNASTDRRCLEQWLESLAGRRCRIKGFVDLSEDPGTCFVLQYVDGRYSLERSALPRRQTARTPSQLVLIGNDLDGIASPFESA